jgi:hypothetical protein
VTVVLRTPVATLVTDTVTPAITAPLGSLTVPEIDPVIPALAVIALKRTAAAMLKCKTDFICEVTAEASLRLRNAKAQPGFG